MSYSLENKKEILAKCLGVSEDTIASVGCASLNSSKLRYKI